MGDKLKQLEIKKLLLEYSYLLTDEELKDEIIDEYQPQFMESFLEKTSEVKKEVGDEKKREEPKPKEKQPIKKKIEDDKLSDETKKRLKTMFRKIMKKTHPDKVNSEDLVHFYVLAKEAYEENNIVQLAFVAQQINVDVDFGDEEIDFMKQLIKVKNDEVKGKETSWLWLWYKAEGQEEIQEKIMNTYVNKKFPNLNKKQEKTMENLNEILEEMYKISPHSKEYKNQTYFGENRNDVYGEITQISTNGIVDEFKDYFNENTVFYDLGCGLGKMVAHIGLQYNPKKSCGVELSRERMKCARHIKETYCKEMDNIGFINESFLNCDVSDATVVYCDNTMYDNELTKSIINILPEGCLFICRREPHGIEQEVKKLEKPKFKTTYMKKKILYLIK
jgi:SAM-dependent methyltransferase